MANIYRATDQRNGQQVAIKIPHPEVESDPALFDRFAAKKISAGGSIIPA